MMRMGIWTENLSLPAVLNECLMQSYTGTLRLFPNTHGLGPARFANLRAAGEFLVSAAWDGKTVSAVTILSEKGGRLQLANPWGKAAVLATRLRDNQRLSLHDDGERLFMATEVGARYRIEPA